MKSLAGYIAVGVVVTIAGAAITVLAFPGQSHKATTTEKSVRHEKPFPPAQPEYARTFQGILDAARPKGEKRIVVKDCRRGRVGNEHFCAWVAKGLCLAGFITEDPGEGTVPSGVGRVPIPTATCSTANVFRWIRRTGRSF